MALGQAYITIHADVKGFQAELEAAAEKAIKLVERSLPAIKVKLELDDSRALAQARSANAALHSALHDVTVNIDARIDGLLGKLLLARAEIARLADTFKVARDLIEIDLDRLGRGFVTFGDRIAESSRDGVDVAITNLEALERVAARVSGAPGSGGSTDVNNTARAQEALLAATQATTTALSNEAGVMAATAAAAASLATAKQAASSAELSLSATSSATTAALLREAAAAQSLAAELERTNVVQRAVSNAATEATRNLRTQTKAVRELENALEKLNRGGPGRSTLKNIAADAEAAAAAARPLVKVQADLLDLDTSRVIVGAELHRQQEQSLKDINRDIAAQLAIAKAQDQVTESLRKQSVQLRENFVRRFGGGSGPPPVSGTTGSFQTPPGTLFKIGDVIPQQGARDAGFINFKVLIESLTAPLRRLRGELKDSVVGPFERIRKAARDAKSEIVESNQALQRFAPGRGLVKAIANMRAFSTSIEAAEAELKKLGRTAEPKIGNAVVRKAVASSRDRIAAEDAAAAIKAAEIRLRLAKAIAAIDADAEVGARHAEGESERRQLAAIARLRAAFEKDAAIRIRAEKDIAAIRAGDQIGAAFAAKQQIAAAAERAKTQTGDAETIKRKGIIRSLIADIDAATVRLLGTEKKVTKEELARLAVLEEIRKIAESRAEEDHALRLRRFMQDSNIRQIRAAEDLDRVKERLAEKEIERANRIDNAVERAERAAAIRAQRAAEDAARRFDRNEENAALRAARRTESINIQGTRRAQDVSISGGGDGGFGGVRRAIEDANKPLGFFNLSLVRGARLLRLLPLFAVIGLAAALAAAAVAAGAFATALAGVGVVASENIAQVRAQVAGLTTDLTDKTGPAFSNVVDGLVGQIRDLSTEFGAPLASVAALVERFVAMGVSGKDSIAIVRDELAGLSGTLQLNKANVDAVGQALISIAKEGATTLASLDALESIFPQASTRKVIAQIATDLGKTTKQVRDLIDAGKLGAGTTIKAVSEVFADLNKNTNGARADAVGLVDQFNKLRERVEDALAPAFDKLRISIAKALGNLDLTSLTDAANNIATIFGDVVGPAIEKLPGIIATLGKTFENSAPALEEFGTAILGLGAGLASLINNKGVQKTFSDLNEFFGSIKNFIQAARPAIEGFGETLGATAGSLKAIGDVADSLGPIFNALGEIIKTALFLAAVNIEAVNAALEALAFAITKTVDGIGEFLANIITGFIKVAEAYNNTIGRIPGVKNISIEGLDKARQEMEDLGTSAEDTAAKFARIEAAARAAALGTINQLAPVKGSLSELAQQITDLPTLKRIAILVDIQVSNAEFFAKNPQLGIDASKLGEGFGFSSEDAAILNAQLAAQKVTTSSGGTVSGGINKLNNAPGTKGAGGKSAADKAAEGFKNFVDSFIKSIRDLKKTLNTADVEGVRDRLRKLREDIIDAFAEAGKPRPDALLARLARQQKRLVKLVKEREAIVARLKLADDASKAAIEGVNSFADITDAFNSLTDAVAGTAGKLADLSKLRIIKPGQDTLNIAATLGTAATATAADGVKLDQILKDRLKSIQDFQADLNTIIKRGVNRNLVQQIVDAGVSGGAATADALANASDATLASINATQKQIDAAAKALGSTAGDVAASVGDNVVTGIVKALKAQKGALVDAISDLVDVIIKRLKKGLGIKSPSTVTGWIGTMTGRGLINALRASLPHVGSMAARLAAAATPSLSAVKVPDMIAPAVGAIALPDVQAPALKGISLPELAQRGGREARAQLDVALADGRNTDAERRHRELVGAVRDGHVKPETHRAITPTPPPVLARPVAPRTGRDIGARI